MTKLRAAVIGVGYLGNFHVQKYLALPQVEVIGVIDTDPTRAAEISARYAIPAFPDWASLVGRIDLVSIVTPPPTHFATAKTCLEAGVHVLVEKPVTQTVLEAQQLIELARAQHRVFQVGHLERFNPAVLAIRKLLTNPRRIEAQRLSKYMKRGTDVDVVLDLMIHDIDIVASIVDSPVREIYARGATVVTGDLDIAYTTLTFANGCVAELAASRVNREPVRMMSVYQADSYILADYLNHSLSVGQIDKQGHKSLPRDVNSETQELIRTDVLMDEITSFVQAIRGGVAPAVSGEDGKRALEIAVEISSQARRRQATRATSA
ncbi:MAG: Gfo/Idh/MocA family oxidoreductase [Gammaproteobacteria bacterium]|nr:Gfo/Idh/MocA family oxidoreductase [Gammaproteobacteria bacterium]